MVALRGLLLLLFGLAAIAWPGVTLTVLVLWIGAGFLVKNVPRHRAWPSSAGMSRVEAGWRSTACSASGPAS